MEIESSPSNKNVQPLSSQIATRLLHELKEGCFLHCDKLPTEIELSQSLKVSRTVLRDALSQLEREGMIERVRGVGTVINRDVVSLINRLDLKLEYYRLIENLGGIPSCDSVQFHVIPADSKLSEKLSVSMGTPLAVCEKRILATGVPVIYSVDSLPLSLFNGAICSDIDWSLPIFDILERYCGLFIQASITGVKAVTGPKPIRQALNAGSDDALLSLYEVSLARHSRPVMYSVEYYTDFFEFSVLRKKF